MNFADFVGTTDFLPTDEQAAVITSDHQATLVIAGAGSGKTATMANRIAWLLASGKAQPNHILGLTFTRKAAGELAERVNKKIREITRRGIYTPSSMLTDGNIGDGEERENQIASAVHDTLSRPTISTYNSFASQIATSYAMLIGEDPGARLMSEAERYQLMFDIVSTAPHHEALLDGSVDGLTSAALALAAGLIDNDVTVGEARDFISREVESVGRVLAPRMSAKTTPDKGSVERSFYDRAAKAFTRATVVKSLESRYQLLDSVEAYFAKKKELGLIEFADQVSWATRIVEQVADVRESLQKAFPVVLLDEYQDTSVNQARFLKTVFANARSVTAVGDPNQAIYGWRGASANAFPDFVRDYQVPNEAQLSLTQAFRNSTSILNAANRVTQGKLSYGNLSIKQLRPGPNAGGGEVVRIHRHYAADTYQALARRLKQELQGSESQTPPTAAILVRNHSFENAAIEALEAEGIPYEVIGGKSLIVRPEVRAVRSLLELLANPDRNDQLIYLFNFFGLGVQDIRAFSAIAKEHAHGEREQLLARIRVKSSAAEAEKIAHDLQRPDVRLIDSLMGNHDFTELSSDGQRRIQHLASLVHSLQQYRHAGLNNLVSAAIDLLDLPVYAASRARGGAAVKAALAGFVSLAGDYQADNPYATVAGFLSWLDLMEARDHSGEAAAAIDSSLGEEISPAAGIVQILTVNAAKGLEWDIVAIPEMVSKRFDYVKRTYPFWHKSKEIFPFPLRADSEHVPCYSAQDFDNDDDLHAAKRDALIRYGEYDQEIRTHSGDEERRLAYVAFTRPRSLLMLLTYDIRDVAEAEKKYQAVCERPAETSEESDTAQNPLYFSNVFIDDLEGTYAKDNGYEEPFTQVSDVIRWGKEQGLSLVKATAISTSPSEVAVLWPDHVDRTVDKQANTAQIDHVNEEALCEAWNETYLRLEEERMVHKATIRGVERGYLTASDVVALMHDADKFFRDQRRPVPQPIMAASRTGTAVHEAIAHYFEAPLTLDIDSVLEPDQMPIDMDMQISDERQRVLIERFEQSRFSGLPALAIEQPVEIHLAGYPVRCVIDAVLDTSSIPGCLPVTIVDWKTGRHPSDELVKSRELQLGLYRLAWSRAHNVPLSDIDACFYYLGEENSNARELHAGELSEGEIERAIINALQS